MDTGDLEQPKLEMVLNRNQLEEAQVGAHLLALLAFPSQKDGEAREALADALFSERVQHSAKTWEPSVVDLWRLAHPTAFEMSAHDHRRATKKLKTRLRDRAIAGRMTMAFFQEPSTGMLPSLPASMNGRRTIRALAELVMSETGENDPENIMKRAWPQSRPVFHLAAAYRLLAQGFGGTGPEHFGVTLDFPELNNAIVDVAQAHARKIYHEPKFRAPPGALWNVRLIG